MHLLVGEWHPIGELKDPYTGDLLLCAPELVDLDCNPWGIGMGYWQDGEGWLCCQWNMTNDEWDEVRVNPTHYAVVRGPVPTAQLEREYRSRL